MTQNLKNSLNLNVAVKEGLRQKTENIIFYNIYSYPFNDTNAKKETNCKKKIVIYQHSKYFVIYLHWYMALYTAEPKNILKLVILSE